MSNKGNGRDYYKPSDSRECLFAQARLFFDAKRRPCVPFFLTDADFLYVAVLLMPKRKRADPGTLCGGGTGDCGGGTANAPLLLCARREWRERESENHNV